MALKDERWEIQGEADFADLTLLNPILRVRTVLYNTETRIADIEVLANENGGKFEHSRTFSYQLQGEDESLSAATIQLFMDSVFVGANRIA